MSIIEGLLIAFAGGVGTAVVIGLAKAPKLKTWAMHAPLLARPRAALGVSPPDYRDEVDAFTGHMNTFATAVHRLGRNHCQKKNPGAPDMWWTKIQNARPPVVEWVDPRAEDFANEVYRAGVDKSAAGFYGRCRIRSGLTLDGFEQMHTARSAMSAALGRWSKLPGPSTAHIREALALPATVQMLTVLLYLERALAIRMEAPDPALDSPPWYGWTLSLYDLPEPRPLFLANPGEMPLIGDGTHDSEGADDA